MCVFPFRAKFLKQLIELVEKRDAIMAATSLSSQTQERKTQLESLVLPGAEENLPGVHIEDLG